MRVFIHKMIDWKIQPVTEFGGRTGEHKVSRISIETEIEQDCAYTMNMMVGEKMTPPIVLAVDHEFLYHDIEENELVSPQIKFQITGTFTDGRIIKSNIIRLRIDRSLEGDELVTPREVTEFQQALAQYAASLSMVHESVDRVEAAALIAQNGAETSVDAAMSASNSAVIASQKAEIARQAADESGANAAQIADNAQKADQAANVAANSADLAYRYSASAEVSKKAAKNSEDRSNSYKTSAQQYYEWAKREADRAEEKANQVQGGVVIGDAIAKHNVDREAHMDIREMISALPRIRRYVVSYLPSAGIDENGLYLVPSGDASNNDSYTEYIRINSKWESLGIRKIDLNGLARESWVNAQGYATRTWVEEQGYSKGDVDLSEIEAVISEQGKAIVELSSDVTEFVGNVTENLSTQKDSIRQIDKSKLTAPETATVGQIFAVKAVNEDGTLVLEAVDKPESESVDVQINGTSIVSDGVANIPIASTALGAVKVNGKSHGLQIDSDDFLKLYPAPLSYIKAANSSWHPIVTASQHNAVFYGLAKAAGADMKNSSNAVGTYTDEAKAAIQQMIGILSSEGVLFGE